MKGFCRDTPLAPLKRGIASLETYLLYDKIFRSKFVQRLPKNRKISINQGEVLIAQVDCGLKTADF